MGQYLLSTQSFRSYLLPWTNIRIISVHYHSHDTGHENMVFMHLPLSSCSWWSPQKSDLWYFIASLVVYALFLGMVCFNLMVTDWIGGAGRNPEPADWPSCGEVWKEWTLEKAWSVVKPILWLWTLDFPLAMWIAHLVKGPGKNSETAAEKSKLLPLFEDTEEKKVGHG